MVEKMNIIFWGAGQFWDDHMESFKNLQRYDENNWLCICDRDAKKYGREYLGIKVCEPRKFENALYVITSSYVDEIKEDLIHNLGVSDSKIIRFVEYYRMTYAKSKYKDRYKIENTVKEVFKKEKLAVYTCITGNYDVLRNPIYYNSDIDYICFTNNEGLHSDIWNIKYISDDKLDNIHLARYVKIFPHVYLKDYDTSIWVDGKFQIKADLKEYVAKYEKTKSMLCFPHYERDCIYDEAVECKRVKNCVAEDVDRQIDKYKNLNYPANNGLYETGCIVRNHNDITVQTIMSDWWSEIEKYSYRDQLSFPYVLWKHEYHPDICDLDINENRWLSMVREKRRENRMKEQ